MMLTTVHIAQKYRKRNWNCGMKSNGCHGKRIPALKLYYALCAPSTLVSLYAVGQKQCTIKMSRL